MKNTKNYLWFVIGIFGVVVSIGAGIWVLATTPTGYEGATYATLGAWVAFLIFCLIPFGASWMATLFFWDRVKEGKKHNI